MTCNFFFALVFQIQKQQNIISKEQYSSILNISLGQEELLKSLDFFEEKK